MHQTLSLSPNAHAFLRTRRANTTRGQRSTSARAGLKNWKKNEEQLSNELDENGKPITNDNYSIETGLIAQDLLKIEELKDYVSGGDRVNEKGETIKDKYSVAYNNIFVYGLQAIKEMIAENESLKSEVNNLKTEIESIKAHLNMNS